MSTLLMLGKGGICVLQTAIFGMCVPYDNLKIAPAKLNIALQGPS